MNTNEETKYMNPETDDQEIVEENVENTEDSKKETWKAVTIGGVSGILMGAGGLYAMNAYAEGSETPSGKSVPAGSVRTNDQTGMKVAHVTDDMSFGEAFATARQAVGGGGVFHWRGNVYNTYTKEEWNAMTPAERNEFARAAQPEITAEANLHPHRVDNHHHVADNHHSGTNKTAGKKAKEHEEAKTDKKKDDDDDKKMAKKDDDDDNKTVKKDDDDDNNLAKKHDDDDNNRAKMDDDDDIKDLTPDDDDIRLIGTDEIDGRQVAFLDTTGDGEANVAIIDVDQDGSISDSDLIVDNEGNSTTFGDLASGASTIQDDNIDVSGDLGADATLI